MKTGCGALVLLALLAAAAPAVAQNRAVEAGRGVSASDKYAGPRPWQDGVVINQFEDRISRQTFWSDGRSATDFGAIVIYNDGTLATRSGERTTFDNGRSCTQFGAMTRCD